MTNVWIVAEADSAEGSETLLDSVGKVCTTKEDAMVAARARLHQRISSEDDPQYDGGEAYKNWCDSFITQNTDELVLWDLEDTYPDNYTIIVQKHEVYKG